MIESIHKLYETQSLDGAIFTKPLLKYNHWIASRIENSKTKIAKLISRIVQFVTGMIVYPPTVPLAIVGVFINLCSLIKLAKFIRNQRDRIDEIAKKIVVLNGNEVFEINENDNPRVFRKDPKKFKTEEIRIYFHNHMDKCNEIKEMIYNKGKIYQKVWLNINGSISCTSGSIAITIIESLN